jgi:sialic acid synthase SpsE
MGTMEEITEAITWVKAARGNLRDVVLLHCTSAYPAPDDTLNLLAMKSMARDLNVATGYSDHSLGIEAPLAAVALGACVIEKHLTLDQKMAGPDHSTSLVPEEFERMVQGIRRVSAMLGDGVKVPLPEELDTARVARRSVVAAVNIAEGEILTAGMLNCRRPATGIAPRDLHRVVGQSARVAIVAGSVLQWEQLRPTNQ